VVQLCLARPKRVSYKEEEEYEEEEYEEEDRRE
jgi:hypothetical protein